MAAPFELYISWAGFYPVPAVYDANRAPTPTTLVWTKLTETEILNNTLELSRILDTDISDIVTRTYLDGDFTLFGANYDLVKTAIAANLNELILRVDRYNGATYDEYWRGTVEVRGSLDDNNKKVKLSKFTPIDDYTDFIRYKKTNRVLSRTAGSGVDIKVEVQDGGTVEQAILGQDFLVLNWHSGALSQYSRGIIGWGEINYTNELYTGYKLLGLSDDGVNGQEIFYGTVGMAVDYLGTVDAEISLSHQKVFDIYNKMYDAAWYLGQPTAPAPNYDNNRIYIRRKRDTFTLATVQTYTTESDDFQGFKYISPKLVTQQVHMFSKNNIEQSHADAEFVFNVNGDLEDKISESNIFTDAQRLYDAEAGGFEDDWLNDSDWFIGVGNQPVNGVPEWIFKEGSSQLGATTNVEISLAYRMANDINDFHQLDSATYNGAVRVLNPNFAQPAIEQEPFPVATTDIDSLNFLGITVTSLGNMRITKATVGFNDIKSQIFCVQ